MSDENFSLIGGIEFVYWLQQIGKSRTTGYVWRLPGAGGQEPKIKAVNIDGHLYVRSKEIERFWERAEAGEFSVELTVPRRTKRGKASRAKRGSTNDPTA
jgi:hypothetical protein